MANATRKYAQDTSVPVERTRAEIEKLLEKHGAKSFVYGTTEAQIMIVFEMKSRRLRFLVPMLALNKSKSNEKEVAKEKRRRWRSLLLLIKAKLEAVASEIVEFDAEFLAHLVVSGNTTVGDRWTAEAVSMISRGELPPLLLGDGS